ncbi:MAG: DUF3108 domain-containing protein [Chitinophagaceae bacterium]|nr:DUF3108 domain-containing protein [Chitinophagaceae bacterium]
MKLCIICTTCLLLFINSRPYSQNIYSTRETETSEYIISLLGIKVGEATLKKTSEIKNSQRYYHLKISGKTTGIAHLFYNVSDEWATHIDPQSYFPILFYRNIQENKYRKHEIVLFHRQQNIIEVKNIDPTTKQVQSIKKYTVKEPLHDILSGIHILKYKHYDSLSNGSTITMKGFWEDTTYTLQIRFIGKEYIKTEQGKIHSITIAIFPPANTIFEKNNPIQIWFSNDLKRTLLKIKTKMTIGSLDVNIKK